MQEELGAVSCGATGVSRLAACLPARPPTAQHSDCSSMGAPRCTLAIGVDHPISGHERQAGHFGLGG